MRVVLVDDNTERVTHLSASLARMGIEVCSVVENPLRLLKIIEQTAPDVILIDMESPGRDILDSLSILSEHQPTPVVMFCDSEDPGFISQAVDAGVSTYLLGSDVEPAQVRPVIDVAIAQFRSFQALRSELHQTRSELAGRGVIDRAKALVMRRYNLTESEAYASLRKTAMDRNVKLVHVAQRILDEGGES